jgi:hypothetical protein
MGKMSDLYLEIEELVIDAMSVPGIMTDTDVLNYVNENLDVEVDLEFVESILDKFFNAEWPEAQSFSYN